MSDVEVQTVTFGSVLEETPEGLFRMDRIQRDYEAMLAALTPLERGVFDAVDRELGRLVLGL